MERGLFFSEDGAWDAGADGPWDGAGPVHAAGPCPGWSRTRAGETWDSHVGDPGGVWVT